MKHSQPHIADDGTCICTCGLCLSEGRCVCPDCVNRQRDGQGVGLVAVTLSLNGGELAAELPEAEPLYIPSLRDVRIAIIVALVLGSLIGALLVMVL